jgi:hypothetical protein
MVKGWLDKDGNPQEQVYDVAWKGNRSPGSDGKLPPVGNTVDVPNATWTNTIGSSELITVWEDPDFDAASTRLGEEGSPPISGDPSWSSILITS